MMAGIRTRGLQSPKRRTIRESILPDELEEDILVRLPVKSIIRFKSVCKEWNSKFHSPSFKELFEHHNNQKSESSSTVVHTIKLEDLFKMVPPLKHKVEDKKLSRSEKLTVIGPLSNGIYCLTSVPMFSVIWETKIALFNPAIHQFKLLPPFPSRFRYKLPRITLCRFVSSFAKLPSSSDYSVIFIVNYIGRFLFFFYSGEWEMLDFKPEKRIVELIEPMEVCSQRLLNGCWHWMVTRADHYFTVLSFNFVRKSFNLIPGPLGRERNDYNRSIVMADVVLLHDHLASICTSRNLDRFLDISVWMMMDYGVEQSWTKIFSVDPGCHWLFSSLYRIDYTIVEGGSDGISIEKIFFSDSRHYSNKIICVNHSGGHQVVTLLYDTKEEISFNTGGISSYKRTLDSLC